MILNEELYAKNLILGKHKEVKSSVEKIGYLTRYNLHVLNKDDNTNYIDTVKWMQKHQDSFVESFYSNTISNAIKFAKKRPFYLIDYIKITKSELEKIQSLNDLVLEKVLFVLLCMAKHQAASIGFTDGLVKYKLTELCRMARVTVPADDREYILYNILQTGLIECPKKNNTECLVVTFIDNDGDVELRLSEADCKELPYVYLKWKGVGKFKKCPSCGRLMRSRNKDRCTYCEHKSVDDKHIWCIDCGEKVDIVARDGKTCRCQECQLKLDALNKSLRNKRYYEQHKN